MGVNNSIKNGPRDACNIDADLFAEVLVTPQQLLQFTTPVYFLAVAL